MAEFKWGDRIVATFPTFTGAREPVMVEGLFLSSVGEELILAFNEENWRKTLVMSRWKDGGVVKFWGDRRPLIEPL